MDDHKITRIPAALDAILHDTQKLGFKMGSHPQTGALLRTLAATKPGGRFLELGTGTGIGTAWLLSGMDEASKLDSVEIDSNVSDVARRHLGKDPRVSFHSADGIAFLQKASGPQYDFIYADTWPGKFTYLEQALSLVNVGGIYFIDDLLPQPNWPPEHASKIPMLIAELEKRSDFIVTRLSWSSGIMILVRTRVDG